ncbi:hypothetical protein [Emcibacter sp. SYSU 3D8]|uniref:hypothetical protein n=1 Tax=Emcibacter sp. SYSU 3D8 TaxID=3133969 RepID=UPI0031FEDB50
MSRAIAFLALLAVLTLRFVDGASHMVAHDYDGTVPTAAVLLDVDDDCEDNGLHGAAHCASHMADSMQRATAQAVSPAVTLSAGISVASSMIEDGRVLSPPVRPPLA